MITDIPAPEDFRGSGLGFINLAADQVFALYFDLEESGYEDGQWAEEVTGFWKSAQRPLASALTLVHQGLEFLIKARIAAVSPFLLFSSGARDWPRGCDTRNVSFSEFRTLDAQDLVRIHNAVAQHRASEQFVSKFEDLRRRRNTIMHTVDQSLQITAKDVLVAGMDGVHELIAPGEWVRLRREYLENTPTSNAHSPDHVEGALIREALRLVSLFSRSELDKYFGFKRNQRAYVCPICIARDDSGELRPRTAQLQPNTAISTTIYCFVCGETQGIVRRLCIEPSCLGNVFTPTGTCLTCFA